MSRTSPRESGFTDRVLKPSALLTQIYLILICKEQFVAIKKPAFRGLLCFVSEGWVS
jgi:hypothetical protein